ncbi:MAG: hypothetical protein O2931_15405 [Planctomycetota bacterium]|nr:hypothetical protein [Planctomycetota bacterium]MDA1180169.1 hypothetical protein [Planctomycetota bacterium]
MARPRKDTFDPNDVGIYHCITRCVRQLFLIGPDETTQAENTGRWDFCELRLQQLASLCAIDVLEFSLLSNHIHTLLRNRPDVVSAWSDREVARRWLTLHPSDIAAREDKDHKLSEDDLDHAVADKDLVKKARRELSCLSHFQKSFLEPIAKEFNRRDEKKGHFVAERFRCKRIESDGCLLTCSVYIALNAFRAELCDTVEGHPFSSYSRRERGEADWLAPIFLNERSSAYDQVTQMTEDQEGIERRVAQANEFPSSRCSEKGMTPLRWSDYREITLWTATHIRARNDASTRTRNEVIVPQHIEDLLTGLGIDPKFWLDTIDRYAELFHDFVAMPSQLEAIARRLHQKFVKGIRACRARFVEPNSKSSDLLV